MQVGGGHRHVVAESERVVLIDPRVVARLRAVLADSLKSRTGVLIKRPAFGAMIAGRLRSVERTFAFSPVEAGEMAARERCPDDSLFVDVGAADAEARQRNVVDFGERRLRGIRPGRDAHDCAWKSPHRAPDRAVGRTRHHGVETGNDSLVLGRIHRFVRLDVRVALAVAVGVENKRRPALRFRASPVSSNIFMSSQPTT